MRVQLIVEAESPEELTAAAEAIASVMGEPDDGPEETSEARAIVTEPPKGRRGSRKAAPVAEPAHTAETGPLVAVVQPDPAAVLLGGDASAANAAVTLEQLSGLASAVITKGKMTEALAASKAAGSSTGALSEVPPANYGALYAQLQALNA